jgi:transposase
VAKTWSPQGCTPIHYHRQRRRDKVSVISGISVSSGRQRLGLYYQLYFDNIGQEEVCMFLRELLRHLRGQVIVVLDNSSTHQGAPLQQLLRQHSRLHIEHFPSYAPELNPDEGVWSLAKRALANSCPNDVEELVEDVIRSINAIRISCHSPKLGRARLEPREPRTAVSASPSRLRTARSRTSGRAQLTTDAFSCVCK